MTCFMVTPHPQCSDPEKEELDPNHPVTTLLNIITATPSSLLKRVGMLLSRLDNLSHIHINYGWE